VSLINDLAAMFESLAESWFTFWFTLPLDNRIRNPAFRADADM